MNECPPSDRKPATRRHMPNNVVQVKGLFGPVVYQREPDQAGGGTSLRLPFSDITPTIR